MSGGGVGRAGVSARGACEEVGEGAAAGVAGEKVEEGRGLVSRGSGCCIEGLLEGGAEVGGVAEELEWLHGWWTVVIRLWRCSSFFS